MTVAVGDCCGDSDGDGDDVVGVVTGNGLGFCVHPDPALTMFFFTRAGGGMLLPSPPSSSASLS